MPVRHLVYFTPSGQQFIVKQVRLFYSETSVGSSFPCTVRRSVVFLMKHFYCFGVYENILPKVVRGRMCQQTSETLVAD